MKQNSKQLKIAIYERKWKNNTELSKHFSPQSFNLRLHLNLRLVNLLCNFFLSSYTLKKLDF